MTSFVALLRGINVGGRTMVSMADLRQLAETLGLVEVKTLLQSGNLIFQGKSVQATALESQFEKAAEKKWGRAIDFFVRDAREWKAVLAKNPFPGEAAADPGHLVVMALKDKPDAEAQEALKAAIKGREYFKVQGRELYLVYPDGIGRSKLTLALIESKLGTRGTGRNWNTVRKIVQTMCAK